MKTERRSPMITSGVATPSTASNNIAVVITIPASNPASSPAKIALVVLTAAADLTISAPQWNQIARFQINSRLSHEKRRGSAAVQNVAATSTPQAALASWSAPALWIIRHRASCRYANGCASQHELFIRKNFPHALHYHGGSNLLHAGVIKRALAQATVI